MISCWRNLQVTFVEKTNLKILSFKIINIDIANQNWSDKAFNGAIGNQT